MAIEVGIFHWPGHPKKLGFWNKILHPEKDILPRVPSQELWSLIRWPATFRNYENRPDLGIYLYIIVNNLFIFIFKYKLLIDLFIFFLLWKQFNVDMKKKTLLPFTSRPDCGLWALTLLASQRNPLQDRSTHPRPDSWTDLRSTTPELHHLPKLTAWRANHI